MSRALLRLEKIEAAVTPRARLFVVTAEADIERLDDAVTSSDIIVVTGVPRADRQPDASLGRAA